MVMTRVISPIIFIMLIFIITRRLTMAVTWVISFVITVMLIFIITAMLFLCVRKWWVTQRCLSSRHHEFLSCRIISVSWSLNTKVAFPSEFLGVIFEIPSVVILSFVTLDIWEFRCTSATEHIVSGDWALCFIWWLEMLFRGSIWKNWLFILPFNCLFSIFCITCAQSSFALIGLDNGRDRFDWLDSVGTDWAEFFRLSSWWTSIWDYISICIQRNTLIYIILTILCLDSACHRRRTLQIRVNSIEAI